MARIRMRFGDRCEVIVQLRKERTATIRKLLGSLPFSSRGNRWGDEIYFEVPFHSSLESDARENMEVGEVAYWPDGSAIAVFFGPTPISTDGKPRAYSPCNIVGRIGGDLSSLRAVQTGATIDVERL